MSHSKKSSTTTQQLSRIPHISNHKQVCWDTRSLYRHRPQTKPSTYPRPVSVINSPYPICSIATIYFTWRDKFFSFPPKINRNSSFIAIISRKKSFDIHNLFIKLLNPITAGQSAVPAPILLITTLTSINSTKHTLPSNRLYIHHHYFASQLFHHKILANTPSPLELSLFPCSSKQPKVYTHARMDNLLANLPYSTHLSSIT